MNTFYPVFGLFKGFYQRFRAAYMTSDLRWLSTFRVLFGFSLLIYVSDLVSAGGLTAFFSSHGVLTADEAFRAYPLAARHSFLFLIHSDLGVKLFFVFSFVVFFSYALGFLTRLNQFLIPLILISIDQRDPAVHTGAMSMFIALALWTLFLPLAEVYSMDSRRRSARGQNHHEQNFKIESASILGLTFTLVAIYLVNYMKKQAPCWRDGSAVHAVLWIDNFVSPAGHWLRNQDWTHFYFLMTKGILFSEGFLLPLLILIPWGLKQLRVAAFALILLMHFTMALFIDVGFLSLAMACFGLFLLKKENADFVFGSTRRGPANPPQGASRTFFAGEVWAAVLLIFSGTQIYANGLTQPPPRLIHVITEGAASLSFTQKWQLFAPGVPQVSWRFIPSALMDDGSRIDAFRGAVPDMNISAHPERDWSFFWTVYEFHLVWNEGKLLAPYARYMHDLESRGAFHQHHINSVDYYYLEADSPPPGSFNRSVTRHEMGVSSH